VKIVAVLSMLHEPAGRPSSATRRFRGEAPLAWALYRLARSEKISGATVLCWLDQVEAVNPIVSELKARVSAPAARMSLPHLEAVAAARRWEDGWRGGLLQSCDFDRGFHGPWVQAIVSESEADAVLLVDPSAGLVDPDLVDGVIAHAEAYPEVDLCFTPAAPGLSGVLLRKGLVNQLAVAGSHPGTLLAYRPDLPMRDPISTPACAPVPTPVARTTHRFTLDSNRQIDRIANATVHLNGQLISTEAEQLVRFLDGAGDSWALPRELVMELTTRRDSRSIFLPGDVDRGQLDLDAAKIAFEEFAKTDDARIVFGGVGDPLLHAGFFEIVELAHRAGIGALAAETDLLAITPEAIDRLADSPLDIISVNLPAISGQTYQKVMGVNGLKQVMENLTRLVQRRQSNRRGVPVIVPTFVKTATNLAEMEVWNDHWIRTLGSAVIAGPADFAGQIADVSLVQMEPPRRRACSRISRRLMILSDGRMTACEQDFRGVHALGRIGEQSIENVWTGQMGALRRDHTEGNWQKHPLCATCKDWHRP
jgi:hypothetical protein